VRALVQKAIIRGAHVKKQILMLALAVCIGSLLISNPARAQLIPPAKRAARVEISQGPEIESVKANEAIIRWTSNNPGGSDEHFGIVHYGQTATDLSRTAKSHIRLNQGHPETVFRVRVDGLEAHTTYYYKVDSEEANGTSDGVTSPINKFTTP
jgi:phosphodiesterase/alkaline phosphatase D-like protein